MDYSCLKTDTNPAFKPLLILSDINNYNEKELIMVTLSSTAITILAILSYFKLHVRNIQILAINMLYDIIGIKDIKEWDLWLVQSF